MEAKAIIKRLGLAVVLFLVLVGGWNLPVVISLARPQVLRLLPSTQAASSAVPNLADNTLRYDALGLVLPFTVQPNSSPVIAKDWSAITQALKNGGSLAYTTQDFAQSGLTFLTAHSSDYYPHSFSAAFAALGQSQVEDTFYLKTAGVTHTYKVIRKEILDPANTNAFLSLAPGSEDPHRVALVTCWPIPTTAHRLVVLGEEQN